jgi:hypothetical protein
LKLSGILKPITRDSSTYVRLPPDMTGSCRLLVASSHERCSCTSSGLQQKSLRMGRRWCGVNFHSQNLTCPGIHLSIDIAIIRSKYHICGTLTGTLPHLSQQNLFLGVPLVLMPEEVVLLVEKRTLQIAFFFSALTPYLLMCYRNCYISR